MSANGGSPMPRRWAGASRWAIGLTLALGFHAAAAAALMTRWDESAEPVASAPLIMVELAPAPVVPEITPNELPPDLVESKLAEPQPEPAPEKPVEKVELPPDPKAEPELAVIPPPKPPEKPPEKPKEKKPERKHASIARAPSTAAHRAARAAAPAPGATARDSNALPNWKSALMARLERYKRYPPQAQARGESGVAQLAFSVDRSGGVHHARIVRSSGSDLLDAATLALIERAQPLPPPPADIPGAMISITVPLRYNYR